MPETLSALISAGIVVWVLTGDKPETAINIAYSAKLFSPKMELLKLMVRSKEAAQNTIDFYLREIEESLNQERERESVMRTNSISSYNYSRTTQAKVNCVYVDYMLFI